MLNRPQQEHCEKKLFDFVCAFQNGWMGNIFSILVNITGKSMNYLNTFCKYICANFTFLKS